MVTRRQGRVVDYKVEVQIEGVSVSGWKLNAVAAPVDLANFVSRLVVQQLKAVETAVFKVRKVPKGVRFYELLDWVLSERANPLAPGTACSDR